MASKLRDRWIAIVAALASSGCASTISPSRQDFTVVEGRIGSGEWNCGTVDREQGGYFYVCDMPIAVERVVLGQHTEEKIIARYFVDITDAKDEIYIGPHIKRDGRAAAIIWRRDKEIGSYILMKFPGRWCVPDWMETELGITTKERNSLQSVGYPLCSKENSELEQIG